MMGLKRCPFCGGKAIYTYSSFYSLVECTECSAAIPADHKQQNWKTQLCEAWNKRVELKHAHWIIYGNWGECSSCHEATKLSVKEHKDYCSACGSRMDEESVVALP